MPSPADVELAAAAAWPATEAERGDGLAPPCVAARPGTGGTTRHCRWAGARELATVERFYAARGLDPIVAVAPLEDHADLDAELAERGWTAEGATDVLVAEAARLPGAAGGAGDVRPVHPLAWPDDGVRAEVLPRSQADLLAFAEGQSGAVLCLRTDDLAGIFRLHVAPGERRRGVARRLLAACTTVAPTLYAQVERDNVAAQMLFASARPRAVARATTDRRRG